MRRPFASTTPTTMPVPLFSVPIRSARILRISASDRMAGVLFVCAMAPVASRTRPAVIRLISLRFFVAPHSLQFLIFPVEFARPPPVQTPDPDKQRCPQDDRADQWRVAPAFDRDLRKRSRQSRH